MKNVVYNMDCMKGMSQVPDKHFDLAIVDPPYGIGQDWKKRTRKGSSIRTAYNEHLYKNSEIPDSRYFNELFRISKNQIIWGYNYFVEHLGPSNYLIVWDKMSSSNNVFKYSKCEIAWTSFKIPCDIVRVQWDGSRMGKETGIKKIHPHQRPLELHKTIFSKYTKPGDKIIDTHVGSGSSRIVADMAGLYYVGFEIDKLFWESQELRFKQYKSQLQMFTS